jgi:nucleoside-diphosphate-sugar epimerase
MGGYNVLALVIGGAGFIGRRVVRLLAAKGHDVIAGDINTAVSFQEPQVRTVRIDLTQFEDVVAAMATHKPDVVVNLGFLLAVDRPRIEALPRAAFKLNILGMDNCLEAARLCGVRHVVYASSIAVNSYQKHYGNRRITEDDEVTPSNQYSTHKVFNEWQAKEYREKHGMCITGIRGANVTGPDKIIGSVDHVQCVVRPALGEKVELDYRDLMRCLIHVDDIAEVFARVAMAERPKHAIYNTGGESMSLGQLADLVRKIIPGADISFQHETGGAEISRGYLYDNDRLVSEFGVDYPPYEQRVREMIETARRGASA